MPFTPAEFRKALGLFPTGVAIVSARHANGQLLGMTVSSFNSVSLSPPLVLFAVAKTAASFDAWMAVERFGVSVLARSQDDLSSRFARSQGEKWALVQPVFGEHDIPLMPGALAAFECARYAVYDGGDHEIFVGRVLSLRALSAATVEPLVFFGGRYCSIARPQPDPYEIDGMLLHGW